MSAPALCVGLINPLLKGIRCLYEFLAVEACESKIVSLVWYVGERICMLDSGARTWSCICMFNDCYINELLWVLIYPVL